MKRPRWNVALIHYTAPPVVGGVERVIGRHASLMAEAGHSVRVVAGRGASPDPRVAFVSVPLADSLHPAIVELGKELSAGRVPDGFPGIVRTLVADLEAALDGVHVVIAHNVGSLNWNLALTAALRAVTGRDAPQRLVLWHHDLAWTKPFFRPMLHEGEPWSLLRTAWPGAIQVAVSETRRDELAVLMGIPASSITVVPGGVDLPQLPAALALADLSPLLLVPVRITARKNIELAIRVVAELRRLGRPAGLVVSGPVDPHDPAEQSYLNGLVALRRDLGLDEAVIFLAESDSGSPNDAELAGLYTASDALLLPSWDEGFGLPVLEAGILRLPVVCSDLPATRAVAGDAATYFPPDAHPAEVAAAVSRRIDGDPAVALARRIRSEYAWPSVYRRCIEPLLARASRGT
jgi:glycosyltransferase involved in cell wall biosynthesis